MTRGAISRLRALVTFPLRQSLRFAPLRDRIIFELRQRHYDQLDVTVPLGSGLVCPIHQWEAWSSFGHIFFEHEYTKAFVDLEPPRRWLDIGCYAGFFSLFVVWLRAQQGLPPDVRALLIDADSRSESAVKGLTVANGLEGQFLFEHGLISGDRASRPFIERPFMTSSIDYEGEAAGHGQRVRRVAPQDILSRLPPPYDLIKIDIEGGEFEFLTDYREVLRATNALLLEWHSWHPGGGGRDQLRQLLSRENFELVTEVLRPDEASHRSADRLSGVDLYRRQQDA